MTFSTIYGGSKNILRQKSWQIAILWVKEAEFNVSGRTTFVCSLLLNKSCKNLHMPKTCKYRITMYFVKKIKYMVECVYSKENLTWLL